MRENTPLGNKWVEAAKLVLRAEYPSAQYEFIDEWPTVKAPESLFTPTKVQLRADLAIVPRRAKNASAVRCLDEIVAVVEVGDLSSSRKLEQWRAAMPKARLIWMPKLDLLEMLWPGAHQFRYRPGPFNREAMLNELQLQLDKWAQMSLNQERLAKRARENITQVCRMLRDATKALKMTADAFGAVHDQLDRQHQELNALADFADALKGTSGLAYTASETTDNIAHTEEAISSRSNGESSEAFL